MAWSFADAAWLVAAIFVFVKHILESGMFAKVAVVESRGENELMFLQANLNVPWDLLSDVVWMISRICAVEWVAKLD